MKEIVLGFFERSISGRVFFYCKQNGAVLDKEFYSKFKKEGPLFAKVIVTQQFIYYLAVIMFFAFIFLTLHLVVFQV